jgi:hypothetical protein
MAQRGQRLRIVAARQQWSWAGVGRWYVVSVPDVELPDGPVKVWMNGAELGLLMHQGRIVIGIPTFSPRVRA